MIGEVPATVEQDERGNYRLSPKRFKNAGEVRDVCRAMIKADRGRAIERSLVDGIANGNPTYSLASLKAKKQGWRARTNYRQMEGRLSELGNTFYDLNVEVDPPVRVFIDYGDDDDQRVAWQETVAHHYGNMLLRRWSDFDYHIPLRNNSMLRHGLGVHVWPIKNKWEPRTPAPGKILFPEDTPMDIYTRGESFLMREFTPVHVLYRYIKNEKMAAAAKWNVKAVWDTLAQASKNSGTAYSPDEYQKQMAAGDYGTSSRQAGVWLNYLFNIDIDSQRISQYVIAESIEGKGEYLCERRGYYDSFEELLNIYPYEVPYDGLLNSVKGFGARSREHFDMLNRLYNSMADNVLISMYPMMKEMQSLDPDKKRLLRVGAFNWIPQGADLQPMHFANLAQGGVPLAQLLNGSVTENNQTYLAGVPEPKDRETALSFQMRAQDSSRVSKATHSLYYRNLTRFHKKVLRTALKPSSVDEPWARLARDFRQACLKGGVPEQALDRIVDIEAMRAVGSGSAAARLQSLLALKTYIYPGTSADRQIAIDRDIAAALTDYSQVNRYARSLKDVETPNNDDTIIALENDALNRGGTAVANSKQDALKHAGSHMDEAKRIVMAVQEGEMEPEAALQAIRALGQHIAQHLQLAQGDPQKQGQYTELMKELNALGAIADQLQQQIEAAADQPSPEQQMSDNLQLGMAKVQTDAAIKGEKVQRDEARKDWQAQQRARREIGQTAAQLRIQAAKQLALTTGERRAA